MRRLSSCVLWVLTACATPGAARPAASPVEKTKILNLSYFDVGSCTAPAPVLPDPLNAEAVVGALVLARPGVLECFVDPKNRGTQADSAAVVKATIGELGAAYEVTGTNLTTDGASCIDAALRRLPFTPIKKGRPPVVGSADFRHEGASPSVQFGRDALGDVVGSIRLAAPAWCDCWALLGAQPPPAVVATIQLQALGAGTATDISFDPSPDPAATALINCLAPKLAALRLVQGPQALTVRYPFLLVNSGAPRESADATPELQFTQLELIRGQRAAAVAVKLGARSNAVQTYDALVPKYKARPDARLLGELNDKCVAMVQSDEALIAALKARGEIDARSTALAAALKAKNPQWAEAEAAALAQVAASENDIKKAEELQAVDQAVCPRERK